MPIAIAHYRKKGLAITNYLYSHLTEMRKRRSIEAQTFIARSVIPRVCLYWRTKVQFPKSLFVLVQQLCTKDINSSWSPPLGVAHCPRQETGYGWATTNNIGDQHWNPNDADRFGFVRGPVLENCNVSWKPCLCQLWILFLSLSPQYFVWIGVIVKVPDNHPPFSWCKTKYLGLTSFCKCFENNKMRLYMVALEMRNEVTTSQCLHRAQNYITSFKLKQTFTFSQN